jgi:dTDP-4-dehydrorhamnose 3,5-epimerase
MNISATTFEGVWILEPRVYSDVRGYFTETFREQILQETLKHPIRFVQENESLSKKGVIRGLHYQVPPRAQSKLVRVVQGKVWDVIVDLRKESATFGETFGMELSAENKKQLFIPKGFAHGYITLSDIATFVYKVDNYYSKSDEASIAFNDPDLAISWPLKPEEYIFSPKDLKHTTFKDAPYF